MNIEGGINPLSQKNLEKTQMEIRDMLQLLLNQRGVGNYNLSGSYKFGTQGGDAFQNELFESVGRLRPPQPNGELGGYSFKFSQEFKTALGGNANPKDLCFLQLQLLETFALIERKDDTIKLLNDELEKAYD